MKTLVYDKKLVKKFLDDVLYNPEFGHCELDSLENQVFCLIQVARTKYLNEKSKYDIKSNLQFYKSIVRHKDIFMKKLESRNLNNVTDRNDKILPINCMATYVTINPRNIKIATFKLQKYLIDISYKNDEESMNRLDVLAFRSYHTSPSKIDRCIIDFDAVKKDTDSFNKMKEILQPVSNTVHCIVETHGGYHVYINLHLANKDQKQYIFQEIKEIKSNNFKEIVPKTDAMVVVPGTLQGNFQVKFI